MSDYDLIIVEKEQQGEDLALALGVPEVSEIISIPDKKYLSIETKIQTKIKQIRRKENEIKEYEEERIEKGLDYKENKGYKNLIEKKERWGYKLFSLNHKLSETEKKLERKTVTYWKSEKIIIINCMGHLIDLKLKKNNNHYLSFQTELNPPSPTGRDVKKWIQLTLIEKYLERKRVSRLICATDYDREGEAIFGTIMDFYGMDLNKCYRMKFSTLEIDVLKRSYNKLEKFNISLYRAGEMRRWMDFIIGYNLSPLFAEIYREAMTEYLETLNLKEEAIDKIKYSNTFNIGRVKLVIMDYIYRHTKKSIEIASQIENKPLEERELETDITLSFQDEKGINHTLLATHSDDEKIEGLDLSDTIIVSVENIEFKEIHREVPRFTGEKVPTFLNYTKVFNLCSNLGATTDQINRILEYLYLQKYISYPRSKSEKWELPSKSEKERYANEVLKALERCGYPTKDYYYKGFGNEGGETHSHPCIHPLPSIKRSRIEMLKRINPLAYMVFNEITIHTLKCFEKLPKIQQQQIDYLISQRSESLTISKTYDIKICEENIISYSGLKETDDFVPELNLKEGEISLVKKEIQKKRPYRVSRNRESLKFLNDFEVLQFLNREDIGTDATRSLIINELINLQYLVSNNLLITTYLGNILNILSQEFVDFIDIEYTLKMESLLNDIENNKMSSKAFKKEVRKIIEKTYEKIKNNQKKIKKLFLNAPECEVHKIPMVIKAGRYGKFLQCPLYYTEKRCDQKFSL
jgi:DNA topoisomerase III